MYKVGDKVRITSTKSCSVQSHEPDYLMITQVCSDGKYYYEAYKNGKRVDNCHGCLGESDFELLNKNKLTIMQQVNIFVKKLIDEDTKLLVEAGLLDSNLNPTTEGKEQSDAIDFLKNKKELVIIAKEIIDEREKEKCKK